MIVRGAHGVRRGARRRSRRAGRRRDLFLVDAPTRARGRRGRVLVAKRLPAYSGVDPLRTSRCSRRFIAARRDRRAETRLREALNPAHGAPVSPGARIGDKLMLCGRNLHELGLMNGTVLRLIDHSDEKLTVSADGLIVELPDEEAPRLQLAYACSIHKGQGIELPVAIVVAHPAAGPAFCAARCSTRR